ncbi:MAG: WYL domain-containing protein [Planctomycetaceae bacterium]|nr:WYL domain-containing protein [Planctomycetaceae bacterium]
MRISPQLGRQWKVLRLLDCSRVGYTINELVRETEVSEKTVRRDLQVLQTEFSICEVSHDGVKRWQMPPLGKQLGFQLTELMAMHLFQQFLDPLAGTPFWEGSRSVFQKVKGALGDSGARYLQQMSTALTSTSVGAGDYEDRGGVIDRLLLSMEENRVVTAAYRSSQRPTAESRRLHPLGMVHHRGSLYLIAWSVHHGEVRNFKIDRMESADLQQEQFEPPEAFDLSDWLSKCFGVWRTGSEDLQTIRIQFTAECARYVQESTWHESQHLESQPDGSLIATFHLPDTQEIKRWIMSFGPGAQALAPAALVNEIQQELKQMLEGYGC